MAEGVMAGFGASGGTSPELPTLYRRARYHGMSDATPPGSSAPVRYSVNNL